MEVENFVFLYNGMWNICKNERGKLWIDMEWFPGHIAMWKKLNEKKSYWWYTMLHIRKNRI